MEHHELTGLERALSVGFSFVVTELDFKHIISKPFDNGANLSLNKPLFREVGQECDNVK
jgi:hypothetical protein